MNPLHFSHLRNMAESAAHAHHYGLYGLEQTSSMRLGEVVDKVVFSLASGSRQVLLYQGRRAGKAWEEFRDAHQDAYILIESEKRKVYGMAEAVARKADAMRVLQGRQQHTFQWRIGKRLCEGTPDAFGPDYLSELKTTKSSRPERFEYDGRHRGYHAQLAWYDNGLVLSKLAKPRSHYVVAVESKAPHPVTVFELTERAKDQGTRLWRLWFEQFLTCEESGFWPEYVEGIVPFDVADDSPFTLRFDGEDQEVA
jgi:hypothetical protein